MSTSPLPPALPPDRALPPGHLLQRADGVPPAGHGRAGGGPPATTDLPGLNRVITPGLVLRAVGRRKFEAAAAGVLLAAATAAVVWAARPDKFTSLALLRIASSEERILRDAVHPSEAAGGAYVKTQLALLRSRPVLRAALRAEKVRQLPVLLKQPDPIEWLEKELKAEQIEGTEIVRLSLTTREGGGDLAQVVNAVTEAYMAEVVKGEHATQLARLDDLERVYSSAEEKLRSLQTSVQTLTRDLKGGDSKILTLKQQSLLDEYAAMKREIAMLGSRDRELEVKAAAYRLRLRPEPGEDKGGQRPPDHAVERDLDADPRVLVQEAEVARLQGLLKQYEEKSADPQSGLKLDAQRRLDAARADLRTARDDRRAVVAARHQAAAEATAGAAAREGEAERAMIQRQKAALQTEAAALKKELDGLGLSSVELDLKRGQIERSEQFIKAIWDQKERIEVELKGSARHRVTIVAPAEDAVVLNKTGRAIEAAGAGAAGLCLGLFLVGLRELRRDKINGPADVSWGLRLRVIGALPSLPAGAADGSTTAPPPAGRYARGLAESVDGIRTMLLHEQVASRAAVLMVASATPGEGKTTLATQLATSFARARRRTLLIDGDLRSPSLHRVFGVPRCPGLGDFLARPVGAEGRDDAAGPGGGPGGVAAALGGMIRATAFDGLHLLPAGDFSAAAVAGMAHPAALDGLFRELRGRYDFIVIDSSPVLLVPDALMVARHADGLLVAVRPGVSRAAKVYAGYERLNEHRLPFVGVVVNGVPLEEAYTHGYGDYAPAAAAGAAVS